MVKVKSRTVIKKKRSNQITGSLKWRSSHRYNEVQRCGFFPGVVKIQCDNFVVVNKDLIFRLE